MYAKATLHQKENQEHKKDSFSAMKEVNIKLYRSCFLYGVECIISCSFFLFYTAYQKPPVKTRTTLAQRLNVAHHS